MASFDRRAVITGALAAAGAASLPGLATAAAALPLPAGNALHFDVYRNGKPFGKYQTVFAVAGNVLTVTSDVAMSMKIANMTVFDYQHHCEEVWRDGRFAEMRSHSLRDKGKTAADAVTAIRGEFDIRVTTNKGPLSISIDANPLTHWNQATLPGKLFNPQDGLLLDLTSHPVGRDAVTIAKGSQITANHFALRGAQTLDEWYDDGGIWAGLKAVFPDKSIIEYRRV
jgi:hypothetical protein